MTLGALGAGYLAAGVAIAIGMALVRRVASATDAILLVGMWPLWAPLAWTRGRDGEPLDGLHGLHDPGVRALRAALARVHDSPLAAMLPDEDTARVLAERLREAGARSAELEALLARPEFDRSAAEARAAELAARGATVAAATVQLRVRTLGELRRLRERYRAELDEVHELIAQLVTQAELVRLQPACAPACSELVRELVAQIEGLEDLFAAQASLDAGDPEYLRPVARSS